jgi:hypothetical protein
MMGLWESPLEMGSPPGSRSFEADGRKQQIMLIREEVHAAVLFRMRNAPIYRTRIEIQIKLKIRPRTLYT